MGASHGPIADGSLALKRHERRPADRASAGSPTHPCRPSRRTRSRSSMDCAVPRFASRAASSRCACAMRKRFTQPSPMSEHNCGGHRAGAAPARGGGSRRPQHHLLQGGGWSDRLQQRSSWTCREGGLAAASLMTLGGCKVMCAAIVNCRTTIRHADQFLWNTHGQHPGRPHARAINGPRASPPLAQPAQMR